MMLRDLAFAGRSLRKSPIFALTAALTIALGIGASTAIFSVTNAVLLRPIPYKDPDRLVIAASDMRNRNVRDFPSPMRTSSISATGQRMHSRTSRASSLSATSCSTRTEHPSKSAPQWSPRTFRLVGAKIVLGRDFSEADGLPQPAPAGSSTWNRGVPTSHFPNRASRLF
jgi:hypothetical protein